MAAVKDIDLEDNLELKIIDGDFKVSESDRNHIWLIVKTYLGTFKQFPLLGVGIDFFLSSTGQQRILKRDIAVQLESDSYNKILVELTGVNEYTIDADRLLDSE